MGAVEPGARAGGISAHPQLRQLSRASACRTGSGVRPEAPADLLGIVAALAGAECASPGGDEEWRIWELERRLRQREQDLTAALARVVGLEAAMQARLQQVEGQSAR